MFFGEVLSDEGRETYLETGIVAYSELILFVHSEIQFTFSWQAYLSLVI
jgi:hypothetical protein